VRERGFGLIVYAVLALAILGTLSGIAWKIRESGKDAIRVEWAEANRLAQEAADKERAERALEGRKAVIALQQAQGKAKTYETRYQALRRSQANATLATCRGITPPIAKPATGAVASREPDSGLRLTPAFVLLWDAAWTGPDGEPLWPHPAGAAEGTSAADPVEPQTVLDTHAENASRCSANSRQLAKLINLIERLR